MQNIMEQLLELAAEKEALEVRTYKAVMAAREEGISWGKIAQRIGGTRQAVQQKFGTKNKDGEPYPGSDQLVFGEDLDPEAAEAANALAALTGIAADRDADATAIFLDGSAPAPEETCPKHGYAHRFTSCEDAAAEPTAHQLVHLGGSLPTGVERSTGKGPSSCPACQRKDHRAAGYFHCAEVTPDCEPTKYDSKSITDYLTGKVPAYEGNAK